MPAGQKGDVFCYARDAHASGLVLRTTTGAGEAWLPIAASDGSIQQHRVVAVTDGRDRADFALCPRTRKYHIEEEEEEEVKILLTGTPLPALADKLVVSSSTSSSLCRCLLRGYVRRRPMIWCDGSVSLLSQLVDV